MLKAISFKNVKYSINEKPILQGVSFGCTENERICIFGENGAGKSTLLKILCGMIPPALKGPYVVLHRNSEGRFMPRQINFCRLPRGLQSPLAIQLRENREKPKGVVAGPERPPYPSVGTI